MAATVTRQRLLEVIDRFAGTRVAVIADIIADEFIYGEISRVSREAPVLILRHRESHVVPGGGGNAIYNLRSLGALPIPVGCVGADDAGRALVRLFREAGIPTGYLKRGRHLSTTRKTRILAGLPHSNRQQVLRIDRESHLPTPAPDLDRFLTRILPSCAGALISDYGIGSVPADLGSRPALRRFLRRHPVTVDSRHALLSFAALTAATPNEGEAEAAVGFRIGDDAPALERAGRELLAKLRCPAVLITRGNRGMSLFERRRPPLHIPIFGGEEIADVTGAGDTVIATFTLALCCGASFAEAAHLSNHAGGIVVMKRGTATVDRRELVAAVASDTTL